MSHPILNSHPEFVAFSTERNELDAQRADAMAAQRARADAYQEQLARAIAKGAALPIAPESAAAVEAGFLARRADIDHRSQVWLVEHRDDLIAAAHEREDELMAEVAAAVAVLDAASTEFGLLNSLIGHVAIRTSTGRGGEIGPGWSPDQLIEASRARRRPLRWELMPEDATKTRAESGTRSLFHRVNALSRVAV